MKVNTDWISKADFVNKTTTINKSFSALLNYFG